MVEFKYVITDELGMHARPVGQLVKLCKTFQCAICIGTPAKMVDATRIFGIMGLALKQGDEFVMTFEGSDEEEAAEKLGLFLRENL